jgi:hypothetical protein
MLGPAWRTAPIPLAAAAEQLTTSIHEITQRVTQPARMTESAAETAQRTDGSVRTLAAGAQKIGDVVGLISSISGQTNMLALNAAIGRGARLVPDDLGTGSSGMSQLLRLPLDAIKIDKRFIQQSDTLYPALYCRRGQAENHIKSWTTHLAADRTSRVSAAANQLRLMLHTGAYWPLWSLRLLKIATRIVVLKTSVMPHLPSACPDQAILRLVLERIPRLVI